MMSAESRQITRDDIMPMADYGRIRAEKRKELRPLKMKRQVSVGPHATFYFESFETMWHQVHEMLWIEKGGEAQIADELAAYNPLVPKGNELVATLMFEVEDPIRRANLLKRIGHVEDTLFIQVGGAEIAGQADGDELERTTPDGKTSAVHFVRFVFTPEQAAAFREPGAQVIIGMKHENYAHMTILPQAVREELSRDFA